MKSNWNQTQHHLIISARPHETKWNRNSDVDKSFIKQIQNTTWYFSLCQPAGVQQEEEFPKWQLVSGQSSHWAAFGFLCSPPQVQMYPLNSKISLSLQKYLSEAFHLRSHSHILFSLLPVNYWWSWNQSTLLKSNTEKAAASEELNYAALQTESGEYDQTHTQNKPHLLEKFKTFPSEM